MRMYKSLTVRCSQPGAFEIKRLGSGRETDRAPGEENDGLGPLEYDNVRGRLFGLPFVVKRLMVVD